MCLLVVQKQVQCLTIILLQVQKQVHGNRKVDHKLVKSRTDPGNRRRPMDQSARHITGSLTTRLCYHGETDQVVMVNRIPRIKMDLKVIQY